MIRLLFWLHSATTKIFKVYRYVVKLFVVDKCIHITNTFHAENIKRRNRENSIENGESAYSYFLITFNLSFVTQIRSAEKKEKSYHAARHEAREKEDDQTSVMIQQLFLYYWKWKIFLTRLWLLQNLFVPYSFTYLLLSTTLKGLFKREVYAVLQALTIVLFMVRIMVSFQGCYIILMF